MRNGWKRTKWDADKVFLRLREKGLKMISEFTRVNDKVQLSCEAGHVWSAQLHTVLKKTGCRQCYNLRRGSRQRKPRELVVAQVLERGFKLIGEYKSGRKKTLFKCINHHVFDATPEGILSGKGCRFCAWEKLRLSRLANPDEVRKAIMDKGIVLVGPYVNRHTKTEFVCRYGHKFTTSPGSVLKSKGCLYCTKSAPKSKKYVNGLLASRDIKLVGGFHGMSHKAEFQCSANHKWLATPTNVVKGRGCPECAAYGFNPSKPAWVYLMVGEDRRINFGITNRSTAERKRRHELQDGIKYWTVAKERLDSGSAAREIEKKILRCMKTFGYKPIHGSKEKFFAPYDFALEVFINHVPMKNCIGFRSADFIGPSQKFKPELILPAPNTTA